VRLIAELQEARGPTCSPAADGGRSRVKVRRSSISTATAFSSHLRETCANATKSVLLIALVLSVLCMSDGVAKNAPGSAKWCKHHPKSTLSAARNPGEAHAVPPLQRTSPSPNPVVETGGSDVYAVISVRYPFTRTTVEIVSGEQPCGQGSPDHRPRNVHRLHATATIDDDATPPSPCWRFVCGRSRSGDRRCEAGTDPTYTATFTIDPRTDDLIPSAESLIWSVSASSGAVIRAPRPEEAVVLPSVRDSWLTNAVYRVQHSPMICGDVGRLRPVTRATTDG